jgi:hypothetical protein
MGRSAEFVSKASPIERYDAAAHNPCRVGPYELRVEKAGTRVLHHVSAKDQVGQPLPDYVTTADLAIGSGTRGRSYLCIDKGAAWQSPISWFGPDSRWDVSPGFDLGQGGRRHILTDCLYCHVDRVDAVPNSLNRYREPFPVGQASIGCERCHGPGQLHVAERSVGPPTGRIDTSIVNPTHLSPDLRASICAQCHLQGEERTIRRGRELSEFRPGLPLEMFLTVYVRHPSVADLHKSVGQFEQIQQSRCFIESRGSLGCTSCHNPHATPDLGDKDKFYNDRCLVCHGHDAKTCSEKPTVRKLKNDSCIACHMPRPASSNIAHTSVTDHSVPRKLESEKAPSRLQPGDIPIIAFPIGPHTPSPAERERDLGIAMSRMISHVPAEDSNIRQFISYMVVERLTAAVSAWRDDLPAWNALYLAYETQGYSNGMLEAATNAAALAPDSELAQGNLAAAAATTRDFDVALRAAGEAIRLSPSAVEPLLLRAGIYQLQGDWVRAESDCRAALAIHPIYPRAHLLLGICRHHRGDAAGGRKEAELATSLATKPQQRTALLDFYREQTR